MLETEKAIKQLLSTYLQKMPCERNHCEDRFIVIAGALPRKPSYVDALVD